MSNTHTFPLRAEVETQATWDLTAIFSDEAHYQEALKQYQDLATQFQETYQAETLSAEQLIKALRALEDIDTLASQLSHYVMLPVEVDRTDSEALLRYQAYMHIHQKVQQTLQFFTYQLLEADESLLDAAIDLEPYFEDYLSRIKHQKKDYLGAEIEKTLLHFQPSFDQFYDLYNQAKLADLSFPDFEVDGQIYPMSFVLYEDLYMYHEDTTVRRTAFASFAKELAKYQHTFASSYYGHVMTEKAQATVRGYDSVIDYLLDEQRVDASLYHRQIDLIMEHLAPVMQKYIRHVQEVRDLEQMTYADLKIALDPAFSSPVSFAESKTYVEAACQVMGPDYFARIEDAYQERWVDWAQNIGKSTGGFATMAADVHPYILMSWTGQLSDVYTLIHELGHAGQMLESDRHNSVLSADMSMYIVEAPSTFNELLLTGHLLDSNEDIRTQRYALSNMISNTYFHNFVTHLLEAAYQREVYRRIDRGEAFTAETLSQIKLDVLHAFWGDAVEMNSGAELTWMRQPHYYLGLYPYTYSAGLTIATQAFLNIRKGHEEAIHQWKAFLTTGNIPPVEAARIAGVDISTEEPLMNTIQFLDQSVDQIIAYSQALGE